MERDVRYLLVGVVVIALLALFVGFVIWQAGGLRGADQDRYTVFSQVGVAGLERGSVVRYLGVRVGQVDDIRLSDHQAGRVEVDIRVQRNVVVTPDPGAAPPARRPVCLPCAWMHFTRFMRPPSTRRRNWRLRWP